MSVRKAKYVNGSERSKTGHFLPLLVSLLLAVAGLFYVRSGANSRSWPETSCTIVGSRVIRSDIKAGPYGAPVRMYRGQYQLRYAVNQRDYFKWVDTIWLDQDEGFVRSKILTYPSEHCDYVIRYNPSAPAEAVVQPR